MHFSSEQYGEHSYEIYLKFGQVDQEIVDGEMFNLFLSLALVAVLF